MEAKEFLELFIEEVEVEDTDVSLDTPLSDIEEWDSLAVMTVISIADEHFGKKLNASDIKTAVSINDLYQLLN
jgi:acyl carrier protein